MRASVKTLVAVVLATVASCSEERQSVPSTLVYAGERGPAAQLTYDLLLTRDGTVIYRNTTSGMLPLPPARFVRGRYDVITADGGFYSGDPAGPPLAPPPPTRLADGVQRFLGDYFVERADGSVFDGSGGGTRVFRDFAPLRGVTNCRSTECIMNGRLIDVRDMFIGRSDTPRPIDFPDVALEINHGVIEPLFMILASGGRVYAAVATPGPSISFHLVEGVPPIRRLHVGFMEDGEARIWYLGPVTDIGLPAVLLPPNAHRHPCEQVLVKHYYDCVEPVELPALRNTVPYTWGRAVYAIMPDGTVRCWSDLDSDCRSTWRP